MVSIVIRVATALAIWRWALSAMRASRLLRKYVISDVQSISSQTRSCSPGPLLFSGGSFLLCLPVRSPQQGRLSYVK